MLLRRLYLLLATGWLLMQPVADARAELVVVVNARLGVAAMTRNEGVNIFFGRNRQFFNGVEAHPADMSEVNAYWSRQVFSGRMQPPPKAASAEDVLKWVVSHPGGIGFVELSKADARVRVVYELGR